MNAIYSLQVNDSGAWRNVVKASTEQMREIECHAILLARAAGDRYKWRIIDAALGDVIGYLSAPDYEWRGPTWLKND